MNLPAFEVDREGLKKILSRRGVEFAVLELIQNAFDENITFVDVRLRKVEGRRDAYELTVTDDCPEGFKDLSHAWTLFAESAKKTDPEKRGRFNLGEKLVIAVCEKAEIVTTTGCVVFEGKHRTHPRRRRDAGSTFKGVLRLTNEEHGRLIKAVKMVLVPSGVTLHLDADTEYFGRGDKMALASAVATLPTEIADAEGYLRQTQRKTQIVIFAPDPDEVPTLYEMGIPVVETGDRYHVNVLQKIPLNADRDNVTPSYLRTIRALVLNETAHMLSRVDAKASWVTQALESEDISPVAVEKAITLRYGEKRVIADPSDPEGTKMAMAAGYSVIQPGSLPAAAWENVRSSGAALPAGKVTPSPKPYGDGGDPLKILARDKWTDDMEERVEFIQRLHGQLVGGFCSVDIASDIGWPFGASYGSGYLTLNLGRLGHRWFEADHASVDVMRLLLHEFAHAVVKDHLSNDFHDQVAKLGAKAVGIALENPKLFGSRS